MFKALLRFSLVLLTTLHISAKPQLLLGGQNSPPTQDVSGGVVNINDNLQAIDQSSNLFGDFNKDPTGIRLPTALNNPIDLLKNNLQVGEGLGGIKNVNSNTQFIDQSASLDGTGNSKTGIADVATLVNAPIKLIDKNAQFAKGPGGIENEKSNLQIADQSTHLVGKKNSASTVGKLVAAINTPIEVLTNNLQVSEGNGGIKNIEENQQFVDQSSVLKGKGLSESNIVQLPAIVGAPVKLLTSNKQITTGDGKNGGIKNIRENTQNANLNTTLEGEGIQKTGGLIVGPQVLLDVVGLNKNSQKTSGGGPIENKQINTQTIDTDTAINGSNIKSVQLGKITPQALVPVKLINSNDQSTGGGGEGGAFNTVLNKQESSNRIVMEGSNDEVLQVFDINPQLIFDTGLAELTEQKTGGPGSAKHKDITKQSSDNSMIIKGDNNQVDRVAVVGTQGVVKLRIGEIVKQGTGLISGKEVTSEECVEEADDIIIQEKKSDITQIGDNNTVNTLANVGGQLIVDGKVASEVIQHIRCKNRKTTTMAPPTTIPPTEPPTTPPTTPPTEPPTMTPTMPPTMTPTMPPTEPPTMTPTMTPTTPPTEPPTMTPTMPPTEPPTMTPTMPPTTPPTEPPTMTPTMPPTTPPTEPPTMTPTMPPTTPPTEPPTMTPTMPPTTPPTEPPTMTPTMTPTMPPTTPSTEPPTMTPTMTPTMPPTEPPTMTPTMTPTMPPTTPSTEPPTMTPTMPPTMPPTEPPTMTPTMPPTEPPTMTPTMPPTTPPTEPPTMTPTMPPTMPPTEPPTMTPTMPPTMPPTEPPTMTPTMPPTTPPIEPSTMPPTLPPTQATTRPPIRRCYRKYCRKWRKMKQRCFRPIKKYY